MSVTAVALLTAGLVAGCGGGSAKHDPPAGSSSARQLLTQTLDGHRTISSGVISLDVKVVPSGSSTITKPIELSFSGPFTSSGSGKVPESDFTIQGSAQGQQGSLQVISAGGKGYITVSGASYEMPASSFKTVGSGLGSLAGSGSGGTGSGGSQSGVFSKLGIHPLDWLSDPQVVGEETVGGTATTHIRATVDARAMLRDVSRLLGKAGSLGVGGQSGTSTTAASGLPTSISAATQTKIANAIGSPSFDLWTGKSDKIVRKLTVTAKVPVTGQTRTLLGGMSSAAVTIDFAYSDINKPQTITAPALIKPYSEFQAKVNAVLQEIEAGLILSSASGGGAGSTGATGSTGSTGSTGTSTSGTSTVSSADQAYTHCIVNAKGDVAKMQKCSSLLAGG